MIYRHAMLLYLCVFLLASPALGQTQSAWESDRSGWVNLLADRSLKDWIRTPLGGNPIVRAGTTTDPSPWKFDPTGNILFCDGKSVGHELLRYTQELRDFVIHAEFRFPPVEGETKYNSGIYFRTNADGTIWHQAQATLAGGFLFMSTVVNGTPQRANLQKEMKENRVKPAGEWNVYEIRAVGKQLSLWVNGAVVSEFPNCDVPVGYMGLEAEGYGVEYRNVQLKRLP